MELDRQTIERKDFPIGRRGYEPQAVDEHLAALAREVEGLRSEQSRRSGESLATAAAAQVQAIVEAAETTAADIARQADLEARRVAQDAERDAERTREEAIAQAKSHVESVSQATTEMVRRIGAMQDEVNALVESVRAGAQRLSADLAQADSTMGELYDHFGRRRSSAASSAAEQPRVAPALAPVEEPAPAASRPEPELKREPAPEPEAEAETEAETGARAAEPEPEAAEPAPRAEARPAPPPPDPSEQPTGVSDDLDGARLVALNMALNGQTREEADRYLAERFDIPDRESLLDEVYAAVEG